jgi:DNA-binding IclR family transcriptional regulator
VLAAFDSRRKTRGVTDLAAELQLSKTTVHRILQELTLSGFLTRTADGRYEIGLRMFELGTLASGPIQLRNVAVPRVHALYERTHYTVYLTILDGFEVVHLEKLPAPGQPEIGDRLGGRRSLHCTSVGKVLLAFSSPDRIKRYVERPLRPMTSASIRDPKVLCEHLETVRATGLATSIDEAIVGVYGIAAPVFDAQGEILASVAVAGHDREVLGFGPATANAARAITRDLRSAKGASAGRNAPTLG